MDSQEHSIRSGSRGKRPRREYTRSDERLAEVIGQLLEEIPDVDARRIHVEVKDASVTLSGAVPDRWTKLQAAELIASCVDVKEVHNELLVRQRRC